MNKVTDSIEFAKALSDPTRQKIMKLCCCEWRSVGELADDLEVTQPTVSHHLAFLRDANLVHVRPEGRQTFYALNQNAVASCCGVLMLNFAPDIKELA
jgi:DNA-binding transcriptional ArsR family regulator